MKLLLSNSKVIDVNSPYNGKIVDVFIEKGVISEIGKSIKAPAGTIELDGYTISPGFCDLNAHFNEPGGEHREDLRSGTKSAAFSGFTDVCVLPNTEPVIDSKSDVTYIKNTTANGVSIHVLGAVSEGCNGENLTEILDLENAGAIGFTDGLNPIWNTELLLKALQYVQKFKGLIINRPKDIHLSQFAQMHEGTVSTMLGMTGEPSISEEIAIKRDLDILRYAGGRLHFSQISAAASVELIKQAKKEGLDVTCDVAIHQLLYTEDNLMDYDSNYKVDPPFRSKKDQATLLKGLQNGTIDVIVSAHQPQDPENKELEFDLSTNGICSLPTFYSNLWKLSEKLPLDLLISKVTSSPRTILGLPNIMIDKGENARLAVFDSSMEWKFGQTTNPSKSINSPQWNTTLTAKCIAVVSGDKLHKN
ncbi:MAG: dihydroorotase [Marinoscillum sp.]